MKNVIITGATGMVGELVLQECLKHPEIARVTSIVRKPTGIVSEKLIEVLQDNFQDYSKIIEHFTNQDIAYYCIGVYTGTVSREEFRKITVDYTKDFADALKENSPASIFCFLSGMGADQTEQGRLMFAKDKGIAENYLLSKKFAKTYIFRPAYIYPESPRKEPNFSYKIYRFLYPLMKRIIPKAVIRSTHLAKAMFFAGMFGSDKSILENEDIKQIRNEY